MPQTLEGKVTHIYHYDDDKGFTIASFDTGEGRPARVLGIMPPDPFGLTIRAEGKWEVDSKYGPQFRASSCRIRMPRTEKGIAAYLAATAPGVGPKKAEQIVAAFGADTLRVIEEEPERLAAVKGLAPAAIERIRSGLEEDGAHRDAMVYMAGAGITMATAEKIYAEYKERTVGILKAQPYRLAMDVKGFAFKKADALAAGLGIEKDDPYRLQAGLAAVLTEAGNAGSTYVEASELFAKGSSLLGMPADKLYPAAAALETLGRVVCDTEFGGEARYYLKGHYQTEVGIADQLTRLGRAKAKPVNAELLPEALEKLGLVAAPSQAEAILRACSNTVTVITGGPGTGKSTLIKILAELCERSRLRVALTAPTGRAAKRMAELSGRPAGTIHRLLEFGPGKNGRGEFRRGKSRTVPADVVIVDEMSMVDQTLFMHLLDALEEGTRLVLIGDINQLPSIGAGQVLADIIASGAFSVTRLDRVFRQAEGSGVFEGARDINRGRRPEFNRNRDVVFYEEAPENLERFLSYYLRDIERFDTVRDVQVLCPFRSKSRACGTDALNPVLQQVLNPPAPGKKEHRHGKRVFRTGDKVLQTRNNYNITLTDTDGTESAGAFNGDMGIVSDINSKDRTLTVEFSDGKTAAYPFRDLGQLEHAFAMTIHKSQGGEWPFVIIPVVPGPPSFLNRKLFYTAFSRAKSKVVMAGAKKCLWYCTRDDPNDVRHTALAERLRLGRTAPKAKARTELPGQVSWA